MLLHSDQHSVVLTLLPLGISCVSAFCFSFQNSVPEWGAETSLAGQWLPAAGGDGAWAVEMATPWLTDA
jgi:hypothetical protein